MVKSILASLVLLVFMGCESVTEPSNSSHPNPLEPEPAAAVSDGAHDGPAGFYFLPPMVEPPVYEGVFDADVSPVVEVCEHGTDCAASPHARFTMMDGAGSAVVRVEEDDEHYIVDWHTRRTGAAAGSSYRIRVLEDGFELGHADVAVVRNGREKKDVVDGSIALVAGQTLPVVFRIEADRARPAAEPEEPVIVPSTITAGFDHSCGLDTEGAAYCWGRNNLRQLGNGTFSDSDEPVAVSMPDGVTFIALSAGVLHTAAVDATGAAYTWGFNGNGQLGNDEVDISAVPVPVDMPEGVSFAAISAGELYTVALTTTGAAYGWGDNGRGQLGDGSTDQRTTPVAVAMPDGAVFVALDAGNNHTVALTISGDAYAWGLNSNGRLGDGTTAHSSTPVAVSMPAGVSFAAISAGMDHTVAAASDGVAYAWGLNSSGQLGDGSTAGSTTPTPVSLPAGVTVTDVSAGGTHTLALASGGDAYAWGSNGSGRLGDPSAGSFSSTPVAVAMPAGVTFTALSAGGSHSLAVASTGAAYAWGANSFGQLGDGSTTSRDEPVAVSGGVTFQQ